MTLVHHHPGYMFLISILVIGTIAAATALSLMLLGWAAEQNGLVLSRSSQAYEYAQTCAERALAALREDSQYTGNSTITLDNGTCTIFSIGGTGNTDRTLCVRGNSFNATHAFEIHITKILPTTTIDMWEEVTAISLCP